MSLLKNLTKDDSIANEKDTLGGGGALASNVYPSKIKLAYLNTASSGALGLVLHVKTAEGRELRETLWMTSGTAKGGKNYYEKDGQKNYLPGYLIANSLTLLTVGKEIDELETEPKVVNVYSSTAKAEVPTKVEMLTDLLDKDIILGVIKEVVDKTVKNDQNEYVPTGETREQNVIDKVFRASDKLTTFEIRNKIEEAAFHDKWKDQWTDQVRNKATKQAAAGAKGFGAAANQASKKPTSSLFG